MEGFTLIVGNEDKDTRLDRFVAEHLREVSRSQIQRYLKEGYISLNASSAKGSTKVKSNDVVSGRFPAPRASEIIPEDLPLKFLYEDDYVAVIEKPPGMVVHPAGRMTSGTLVNALLFSCRDLQGVGGVVRPGIVHRLDKGTSGVMVVAKNDRAHEALVEQFKGREVKKIYLAICYGVLKTDEGVITSPVGRHPSDRKRFSVRTHTPREALTSWHVKERLPDITFIQVAPKTGRTHQIRVHMSALGHPLVGDPLYARARRLNQIKDPGLRDSIKALGRQALHAHLIAFRHPATGVTVEFTSPLPADMEGILERARRATI